MPNRLRLRLSAFAHACRGLHVLLRGQPNARIHLAAAALALGLGLYFGLSAAEWACLILAITLVFAAEAINTALELAVDLASPEWQPRARDAKDVAAAAVLLSALGALALAGVLFLPRIWPLFGLG